MTITIPSLKVTEIPHGQRSALAWRLREMLADADARARASRNSRGSVHLDGAGHIEFMRGDVLSLIAELEGSRASHGAGSRSPDSPADTVDNVVIRSAEIASKGGCL